MHLKTSLKQLWHESKANPAFTALYIGGVTFAVAFTVMYAMLLYVHMAEVYPEYNRNSTLYLSSLECRNEGLSRTQQTSVNPLFVKEHLSDLKNCEYLTVTSMGYTMSVQRTDGRPDLRLLAADVAPNFFKLYEYDFVAGEPFSQADYDSEIPVAIITDNIAEILFGGAEEAIGKDISIDYDKYRVRGVVRESSSINNTSFSHIFLPLNINSYHHSENAAMTDYLGNCTVKMKVVSPDKIQALKDEINDRVRRLNAADKDGWKMSISNMQSNTEHTFGYNAAESKSFFAALRPFILILLILLIIPAINISGMIGGQMNRRMAEIGLRRSFGANRGALCGQVMFENLILTLVGGAVGLIIVWIVLAVFQNQIFGILGGREVAYVFRFAPPRVTAEMLFAPAVFIGTLIICIILNILSAYIPVRLALRHPIVSSLNQKR